jgi:hypothetical protein
MVICMASLLHMRCPSCATTVFCCLACAAQEREVVADLMSRLEQRTAERNEAMQAAAAAEARVKVR